MSKYDIAVLGAGPGGYVAALRAATLGARVCIIESTYIGGTCLNVGCIPSKALLHTSELFHQMTESEAMGIKCSNARLDYSQVMKRTRDIVGQLTGGVGQLLKARKVDIVMGRGRLKSADSIEVTADDGKTQTIQAENIIIATGSRVVRPQAFPFDGKYVVTTNETTTSDFLPDDILIVGGGIIGCEFATIYSELGRKVTVVEMLPTLCSGLDKDIATQISRSLKKRGVNVMTGSKITSMKLDGETVVAEIEGKSAVKAGMALVAIGRAPVIDDIGLEAAGVELDGRIIKVDDRCRTNVRGIYAIGDCACRYQFAHIASRMGIVAAENGCGHQASDDLRVFPSAVYTHPGVGSCGLSESQAREQYGDELKVAKFPLTASGMARAFGDTQGVIKIMALAKTGEIVGAVCVGPHSTDVIHEIVLAMKHELTIDEIAETIHAHPTFSEAVGEAAELWLGKAVHTLG